MADPYLLAVMSAAPATVLTGVSLIATRRQNQTIGRKNGRGTLVSMVESLVEWKGAHTREHAEIAEEEETYRNSVNDN